MSWTEEKAQFWTFYDRLRGLFDPLGLTVPVHLTSGECMDIVERGAGFKWLHSSKQQIRMLRGYEDHRVELTDVGREVLQLMCVLSGLPHTLVDRVTSIAAFKKLRAVLAARRDMPLAENVVAFRARGARRAYLRQSRGKCMATCETREKSRASFYSASLCTGRVDN